MDVVTCDKWDHAAKSYDLMSGFGPERRWHPVKADLFSKMRADANILFVALGTGLDISLFPKQRKITAIDISPAMLERARLRASAYEGELELQIADVHELPYAENSFDQIFTSCTLCSVPRPVQALQALRRVVKPGGELLMFEHTGSHWFPFNIMMNLMTPLTRIVGPDMNRDTPANVAAAGFEIESVENVFLDVVKTIRAIRPAE